MLLSKWVAGLMFLVLMAPAMSEENLGIHVTGRGEVLIEPDMARLTLQVTRQGRDALALKAELDEVTGAVLKLTDKLKIKRKDVTAALVNVHPNRRYDNNKNVIDGVIATRTIAVTLHDLENIGGLMNGALELGINDISNIQLDSSKRTALEEDALQLAITNAKAEAERIASAFSVRVMGVLDVRANASHPQPMVRGRVAMSSAESGDNFSPGQLSIEREVQATFAIGGQ